MVATLFLYPDADATAVALGKFTFISSFMSPSPLSRFCFYPFLFRFWADEPRNIEEEREMWRKRERGGKISFSMRAL